MCTHPPKLSPPMCWHTNLVPFILSPYLTNSPSFPQVVMQPQYLRSQPLPSLSNCCGRRASLASIRAPLPPC